MNKEQKTIKTKNKTKTKPNQDKTRQDKTRQDKTRQEQQKNTEKIWRMMSKLKLTEGGGCGGGGWLPF